MRDGSETKARLERVALQLFVEKGVNATTIRDIAQRAGVAEGALYRHHPGKDALVWSLFSRHYIAFAGTLDRLQAPEKGLRAKLTAMIAGFCHFFDADRTLFAFLLLVQHNQIGRLAADVVTPVDVIRRAIAAASAAGEIAPLDADLATAMVMGIVLQPATFAVYGRLEGGLSEHAATLADAAWRSLPRR